MSAHKNEGWRGEGREELCKWSERRGECLGGSGRGEARLAHLVVRSGRISDGVMPYKANGLYSLRPLVWVGLAYNVSKLHALVSLGGRLKYKQG